MKITADTNVLLRFLLNDDRKQAAAASKALNSASVVAIALPALCEVVWVLSQGYKIAASDIADALEALLDSENVEVNRGAVDAGLDLLRAGGDFADGVIAFEGMALGGSIFISFNKKAISLLKKRGNATRLLT
ncbi:type II toxin-antitoxin system VapC family toxin [Pusillimonas sp. SM2304]|uniref:type II toxin-antitoxin system VapC family toxin n=1 Tax=Pusillimonas sp. SM2304 TaxID=3073241 RepID=UPI0028753F7F|nr:type II toxin-antitoxin system VapC family toxin [Pusillimonas sp. SM2304]MDS1140536.1 type II toxin-antitoxin system VapC family toxin [Pusillimonas sp. SM2304]